MTTNLGVNRTEAAYAVALQPDGKMVVAGRLEATDDHDFLLLRYEASGLLDPTFGSNGAVTTRLSNDFDQVNDLAIQPDGRIVAVGFATVGPGSRNFAVVRYNTDGTLDTTFGNGGIVLTSAGDAYSQAKAVALQPDGRIVVAGWTNAADSFALVRYHPDGTLDASFGQDGQALLDFPDLYVSPDDLVLQPDGRIVVVGSAGDGNGSNDAAVVRCTPDGSLDTSFGTGGLVTHAVGNGSSRLMAVALKTSGAIVAAGVSDWIPGTGRFALAQYTPGGALDPSFGTGGITTLAVESWAGARDLSLLPDGRAVAVGTAVSPGDFVVARFTAGGDLDPAFGTGGLVFTDARGGSEYAEAVAIRPKGRILVAGYATPSQHHADIELVQYLTDGTLDASFGEGGITITESVGPGPDEVAAVAVQLDGAIVAAGTAYTGSGYGFALARYRPDGTLDPSFGEGGTTTTVILPTLSSEGHGGDIAIQPDGRLLIAGSVYESSRGREFALVRYLTDGSLDPSFGEGGIVTTAIGFHVAEDVVMALQPDSRIVVAGSALVRYTHDGSPIYNIAIVRYTADGTLDPSFGTGGIVTTPVNNVYDEANGLAVLPDGRILVAGSANEPYMAVALRYNPDGSLDPSFGTGGIVEDPTGQLQESHTLAVLTDGKLVLLGGKDSLVLVRLHTDGSLDTSFGLEGVTTTVGVYGADLLVLPDDRLTVIGHTTSSNRDFAITRYSPDGLLDRDFGTDGLLSTDFGSDEDRSRSGALQADGRLVAGGSTLTAVGTDFALARYTVGVDVSTESKPPPPSFSLSVPNPNPARYAAAITYALTQPGPVHLAAYDLLGREVAVLADEERGAGAHEAALDVSEWPSGVYVLRLTTPEGEAQRRLTVVR